MGWKENPLLVGAGIAVQVRHLLPLTEMGQVQSPDLVCEESEVGFVRVKSFAFKVYL